jgi:putative sterol carrier protein
MGIGMMEMPKAPAGITPEKFFMEWVPAQVESFKDLIAALGGDQTAAIGMRITGAGGGDWTIVLEGGKVKVDKGIRADAVVTAIMGVENFIEAITGQLEDLMQPPPGTENMTPEQAAAKAKENLVAMKEIMGTARFTIEDASKPFTAMMKFQGELKDEPDVTVTMDRETALAIASGKTNPQSAFMSGQVQIAGDLTILMQLAPILMPS